MRQLIRCASCGSLSALTFVLSILFVNLKETNTENEYFDNFLTEYFDNRFRLHKYARLTTPELVRYRGYPVEVHQIVTKDGYILEVHRIPYGVKGIGASQNVTKPPVLLYHGGAQSSVDWVLNERTDNCLGFVLADAGYDVWMGNFRGNTYSNKHVTLSLRNRKFWDFTPEEMGIYDITKTVDHILETTGQPKIFFIGFSMATTAFFIALAEHPEYNEKIRLGVTFGVAAYQYHSFHLSMMCRFQGPVLELIRRMYGSFPIPNHFIARAIHTFIPHICNRKTLPLIPDICWFFWTIGWGFDNYQIPKNDVSLLLSKLPTSTSSKTLNHICNNVNNKRFGKFNYGREQNIALYGSAVPPAYNMSRITAPMSLYSADRDFYCVRDDILLLRSELPNVASYYRVPNPYFNHVDFTYGKDVNELVYQHILKIMTKY